MTEAEWMACADPQTMLDFLRGKASDRKLRLFACACCRRIWHLLSYDRSRCLVEKIEQYADSQLTIFEVSAAWEMHEQARSNYDFKAPWYAAMASVADTRQTAREAAEAAGCEVWWESIPEDDPILSVVHSSGRHAAQETQCRLLRDIFGNLFRPVTIHPTRLTPTVFHLAEAVYDERAFNCLPILADALEEAGCSNTEILAHCRGPGPHVRGCWVIDLLLGKE
jgi:hypothetical protein